MTNTNHVTNSLANHMTNTNHVTNSLTNDIIHTNHVTNSFNTLSKNSVTNVKAVKQFTSMALLLGNGIDSGKCFLIIILVGSLTFKAKKTL